MSPLTNLLLGGATLLAAGLFASGCGPAHATCRSYQDVTVFAMTTPVVGGPMTLGPASDTKCVAYSCDEGYDNAGSEEKPRCERKK